MANPIVNNPQLINDLLLQLPKGTWFGDCALYKWNGSWYFAPHVESTLSIQANFKANDNDIIIASSIKAGTTWLKALVPSIKNGCRNEDEDPLLKKHPHEVIKSLECDLYLTNPPPDLSGIPSPRIFHTHLPFHALPESIRNSKCKIIYIARNPKDTFVSLWKFQNRFKSPDQAYPIDKAFEEFCNGVHFFGPYHDHVLEYWNESLKSGNKMHFMKYEELVKDPKGTVKELAKFLGKPVFDDEEVDQVIWRCSFDRLRNLEVNKTGTYSGLPNSFFFRLGVTGDSKNYLTKEMSDRLDKVTLSKFEGSGLDLGI